MKDCSNCGSELLGEDVLHVAHRGRIVAALCSQCVAPAAKPRVTLKRETARDAFEYDQYVCVEPLREQQG